MLFQKDSSCPLHVTLRRWTPFSVHLFFFLMNPALSFTTQNFICFLTSGLQFSDFQIYLSELSLSDFYFSLCYHEVSEVLLSELFSCYLLSSAVFSRVPHSVPNLIQFLKEAKTALPKDLNDHRQFTLVQSPSLFPPGFTSGLLCLFS